MARGGGQGRADKGRVGAGIPRPACVSVPMTLTDASGRLYQQHHRQARPVPVQRLLLPRRRPLLAGAFQSSPRHSQGLSDPRACSPSPPPAATRLLGDPREGRAWRTPRASRPPRQGTQPAPTLPADALTPSPPITDPTGERGGGGPRQGHVLPSAERGAHHTGASGPLPTAAQVAWSRRRATRQEESRANAP